VLFTDLVGSTSAWSGLDRATADRRRARHFALMNTAVADHGGREVKNLGDGMMAVFESAGEAVASAGTMQRAFAAAARGGEPMLGLRIGLSAGDATEEGEDAFGVPVIAASRLCALAEAGEVLLPSALRFLLGATTHVFEERGERELKGLAEPVTVLALMWEAAGGGAPRVVLADDASLVREGLARLLESEGIVVVAQADDAPGALDAVRRERPDVVVLDIRMPPNLRTDGLEVAEELLAEGAGVGVLLLSTHLNPDYARRLLDASGGRGVGYLAKERVSDIDEFAAAVHRVAAGGTAFDPQLSAALERYPAKQG
jgi:class 3 adenylate cyclase/ActR/RegA family two-component response regulator